MWSLHPYLQLCLRLVAQIIWTTSTVYFWSNPVLKSLLKAKNKLLSLKFDISTMFVISASQTNSINCLYCVLLEWFKKANDVLFVQEWWTCSWPLPCGWSTLDWSCRGQSSEMKTCSRPSTGAYLVCVRYISVL